MLPWAVERPDRIPKQRYYDPDFFAMEAELLWPRVWQMACRLEEIPEAGDMAEYEILDKSVVIVRTADMKVKAFDNACRHRGVKLVEGQASCPSGFVCPFHGWCFDLDGTNTYVHQPEMFDALNICSGDIDLVPVRHEVFGGCVWINFDDQAPSLRESMGWFAPYYEGWKAETLRVEWWESCRLPCNWKLVMEAFMESWHVPATHPQIRYPRGIETMEARAAVEMKRAHDQVLGIGMAGQVHEIDIRIAQGLRDIDLPEDPVEAMATWKRTLNDAVVKWWRTNGVEIADLNEIHRLGQSAGLAFCFPHTAFLPQYSSASAYRFRPLGPEETLMEIWSLTRFPDGTESPGRPKVPTPKPPDDPSWPLIPAQDYSNLPKQQKGLHNPGFEYMRLGKEIEGLISNFERTIDGFLTGVPYEQLIPAMNLSSTPIDVPIADIGF